MNVRLHLLTETGRMLARQRDTNALCELILSAAQNMAQADGASLFLMNDSNDALLFRLFSNQTLKMRAGFRSTQPVTFAPPPLLLSDSSANMRSIITHCAWTAQSILIDDIYAQQSAEPTSNYEFEDLYNFDQQHQYRSTSLLVVPLTDSDSRVIGVLQLVNAYDAFKRVAPFEVDDLPLVAALAAQAGIALANRRLLDRTEALFSSFAGLMNIAIDERSPHPGGHCQRVPELTMMLADAVHQVSAGPFAGFQMSEADRHELHLAGLLHDCGKIATPVHIQDKATRLETVCDRISLVETRFALACAQATDHQVLGELLDELSFIKRINQPGEILSEKDVQRVHKIGQRSVRVIDRAEPLLTADEIYNLSIRKGTLNPSERAIINKHIEISLHMLEQLPWPPHLKHVPEFIGGHHERMDGKGYPKGLKREQMSVQARMMGLGDVFEALTSSDRPYKKPITLSRALSILADMAKTGHVDPDLFAVFLSEKVYLKYAKRFLDVKQIDQINEGSLLVQALETQAIHQLAARELPVA